MEYTIGVKEINKVCAILIKRYTNLHKITKVDLDIGAVDSRSKKSRTRIIKLLNSVDSYLVEGNKGAKNEESEKLPLLDILKFFEIGYKYNNEQQKVVLNIIRSKNISKVASLIKMQDDFSSLHKLNKDVYCINHNTDCSYPRITLVYTGEGNYYIDTRMLRLLPFSEYYIKGATFTKDSMRDIFIKCRYINRLELYNCDLREVTDMRNMFYNVYKLKHFETFNCLWSDKIDLSGAFKINVTKNPKTLVLFNDDALNDNIIDLTCFDDKELKLDKDTFTNEFGSGIVVNYDPVKEGKYYGADTYSLIEKIIYIKTNNKTIIDTARRIDYNNIEYLDFK